MSGYKKDRRKGGKGKKRERVPKPKKNIQVIPQKKRDNVKNNLKGGVKGQFDDAVEKPRRQKKTGFNPKDAKQMIKEPDKISASITTSLAIKVAIDNIATSACLLPTITWLLEKGVIAQLINSGIAPADAPPLLLSFANYLLTGLQNYALGAQLTVTTVPKYINVLFEAMRPKEIPFKTGSMNYSWSEDLSLTLAPLVAGPYSTFVFGLIVDNGTPTDPIIPVASQAGDQNDFNLIVKYFGQEETDTCMVPVGTPAVTTRDGAAFARQYVYNGTSLTLAGGWFCDIESEVPFKCPMFAKFVQYGSGMDVRVSRFLEPSAGDSLYSMGLPLLDEFTSAQYKNRYPPVFKCIDVNLIAGWLCAWAALARETYINNNEAIDDSAIIVPFQFTQQDFYIVVRQALMSVFSSQKCVQFLAPMNFSNSGTNNGFVPLVAHYGTYGNPVFKDFYIPQMLQENLASLKMRSFRPKTQFQVNRNVLNYVPVLGVYVTDEPPAWTFKYDNAPVDLFLANEGTVISLVDGSAGSNYFNLNSSYYQDVMSTWNQFVTLVTSVTTSNVGIGNDQGPLGLSLLCFTNYEDSLTDSSNHSLKFNKFGKVHISNYPGKNRDVEKEKLKPKGSSKELKVSVSKDVKNLPPAALSTLTYSLTSMVKGVSDEELSLLGKLILPVFRLDPSGPDPTNISMLSTSAIEPYLKYNNTMDSNGNISGRSVLAWMEDSAGICITGTAGAPNSVYAEMMKLLAQKGEAGGLGSIAGALLGALGQPQLGALAELIPF